MSFSSMSESALGSSVPQKQAASYDLRGKRVWVAGSNGMVGSALVRRLGVEQCEIITSDRREVDLIRQDAVEAWLKRVQPKAIFVAAAKVGGILANDSFPASFLYENLMIEANILHAAQAIGVEKLMFLGSSCVYPKHAAQPIDEEALLSGPLEPTNQWYAVAKIAGIKLSQAYRIQYQCDFISVMPTNLYGPGDNFDLTSSHVLPALIRKAHEAKERGDAEMIIWGSGTPRREFLHVDDCADACVHVMKNYSDGLPINIGSGTDLPILDLVHLVCDVVGFKGRIYNDLTKPDGTQRKLMSGTRLAQLGWKPSISLEQGIRQTYAYFLQHHSA